MSLLARLYSSVVVRVVRWGTSWYIVAWLQVYLLFTQVQLSYFWPDTTVENFWSGATHSKGGLKSTEYQITTHANNTVPFGKERVQYHLQFTPAYLIFQYQKNHLPIFDICHAGCSESWRSSHILNHVLSHFTIDTIPVYKKKHLNCFRLIIMETHTCKIIITVAVSSTTCSLMLCLYLDVHVVLKMFLHCAFISVIYFPFQ